MTINNFLKSVFFIFVGFCYFGNISASELDSIKFKYYKAEGIDKIDALYDLLKVLRHDHLVEALTYEKEADKLFKSYNYPKGEAKVLGQFGFCYINTAEFEKAFNLLQRSYIIALRISDKSVLAETENNLGVANYFIGNYAVAAQYLMNSYKARVKLNNKSDIANTANNLGLVYNQIKEYKLAKEYFTISLKLKEEISDIQGQIRTVTNICDTYLKLNDIDNAKECFEKALKMSYKNNYESGIAVAANLGGRIYTILNDYDKALQYYLTAKEVYHKRSERAGELQAVNFIAELFLLKKNSSEAYKYLNYALSLKDRIKQEAIFVKTYHLLAEYYEQQGNMGKALENFKIYDKIRDTIFDENKTRQIRELSISYDIENKQKQIDLLNKEKIIRTLDTERSLYVKYVLALVLVVFAVIIIGLFYRNSILIKNRTLLENLNKEILEQKNKLDELNKTKDTLFRIIAHDLRNPFNILIGFSDGLLKTWKSIEEKEKIELVSDINSVSKNSYLLLENLLEWAINQTEGKVIRFETINLNSLIRESLNPLLINIEKKNINMEILIGDNYFIKADPNMINAVVRNIVSNSIKYTEYGGRIKVVCKDFEDERFVNLEISDDGIGMSADFLDKKLNQNTFDTTIGTNNEKGTGLGLILCKELISKNKGYLKIKSTVGAGTTVSIILPKNI